jgi:RNA polymerase sigma-70 factor (ECF subfamily)
MLRFKAGDLEAFEVLFARHVRAVVNFAYRFVRSRAVAEELAQEVFLRVHDSAAGYRPEAKFTTWLYRIATNVCLNEVRKPRFRAVHESIDGDPSGDGSEPMDLPDSGRDGPERVLQKRAVAQALKEALDRLPEKQRVAFVLGKYQELSYAEISEVMQISEKAVKSLIHRAKEALAQRLRPLLPELL